MITRSTRRGSFSLSFFVLIAILFLLHRSRYLIGLLFENGSVDAMYPSTLFNDTDVDGDTTTISQLIPKIIHQTYSTEDIPTHWRDGQQAVKDLHPDFVYMFWTDISGLSFIRKHYPWFIDTYTAYPHAIQRADALRYFFLYHYGGIYLDLDISPYRSFTPLLQLPAFACLTSPTGISNDVLGSTPGHPFYKLVIENMQSYDKNWGTRYITVMYSTGPLFLSVIWIQYLSGLAWNSEASIMDRLIVLVKSDKEGDSYGFFKNVQGGSWHGRDTEVMFWLERHWMIAVVSGFVTGVLLTWMSWSVSKFVSTSLNGSRHGPTKSWSKGDSYKDLV